MVDISSSMDSPTVNVEVIRERIKERTRLFPRMVRSISINLMHQSENNKEMR